MPKILVIDDEKEYMDLIVSALQSAGYETLEAENGARGLEFTRRHLPDLIVCDLMMPELDGYETLEALRHDPKTATIPFIFLTGHGEDVYRRRGMELGADDFLAKPFTPHDLLAAVDSRLKKKQTEIEEVEKKLSELRDNISLALPHELRTPLHSLLGYANILAHEGTSLSPAEVSQIGQRMRKAVTRLHRTIENILLYAQLQILAADEQQVKDFGDPTIKGVDNVVKNVAKEIAEQRDRSDDLKIEVIPGGTVINISESYLRKIVEELVDNALKFSEKGIPVDVTVTMQEEIVSIRVLDRGRGIAPDQLANIGGYMQFDRKLHEQQGSGLGLVLARRLTELHGGKFALQSEVGKGTTAIVEFRNLSG